MERSARSFFFTALFLFLSVFSPTASASPAPNPELEAVLRKIETRHYRWIAIRADVLFFFAGSGNSSTMCGGELLYQRLDERMMLVCADTQKNLAFVFRTFDNRFDLYLPGQNTVYHGSIFDLEDSPDIESHLKARDLYRALKPMTVDPRRTRIERTNSLVTSLDVYSQKDATGTLVRKLYLTPEGDVRGEIYYGTNGRSVTEIQRYDFKEFRGRSGTYDSIIFPKKITIVSPETQKGSALFFTKVTAQDTIDPLEFLLRIPPGTQEVFLEEKALRPKPLKAADAPAPVVQAMPVYLATPLKKPARKTTPPVVQKKKEAAPPKVPTPAPAPAVQTPVKADAPSKETGETPQNVQAPAEQPSGTDDQTTLDPSVDPSLEMGKQ
jgi:hypothetical protein